MKAKLWTGLFVAFTALLCLGCGAVLIFYNLPGSLDRLDETGVTVGFFGCGVMFLLSVASLVLAVCAGEHGVKKRYSVILTIAAVCALGCSLYFGCMFFGVAALMGREI